MLPVRQPAQHGYVSQWRERLQRHGPPRADRCHRHLHGLWGERAVQDWWSGTCCHLWCWPALSWAPRKGWGNLLKFVFPETFFLSTWFQIPRERSSFKTQSGSFFRRASCRCSPTLWSGCVRAAMSRPGMLSWVEWCPLSSWWRGFLWSGCCRTSWPSSKLCSLSWWTSQERYKHFLMSLEIIDVWITYMNFCIPWWLSQVSNGAVAMAKTTLEQLLIRCATPLKDEEKTEELLSAQDKSFHLVTHDLVREVTSPNSTVRKQAMHSLQVLAQVTGKSVTIIMEPHKEVSVVFFLMR